MDRIGSAALSDLDEFFDYEVGFRGGDTRERVGLVGKLDVLSIAIPVGIDSHG